MRHVIGDLMKREVLTCRLGDSLNDVARTMWEARVGALPVLNGDGYVVGFITDRDVCMGAYTTGRRLAEVRVEDAMARKVICCRADQDLTTAEDMMRGHRIRRLPVVDDAGRLVGILSLGDIANHLEFSYEGAGPLGGDSIARTVAAASDRSPAPQPPAG
jgi:CBS domain-containing protein